MVCWNNSNYSKRRQKMKIKHGLLLISIVLISLLAISAVSAEDVSADDSVIALSADDSTDQVSNDDVEGNVIKEDVSGSDSKLGAPNDSEKLSFGSSKGNNTFNFKNITFDDGNGTKFDLGQLLNGTLLLAMGPHLISHL